ncbi:MAG: SDR family oxidoreductase [Anaerolineales bacterium]|nr:SDR family oxidoreductase [Anaerolineales bacterium]
MSKRLENLICIVTGAASGIGRAIVKEISQEGGVAIGIDIQEKEDPEVEMYSADISDEFSVDKVIAEIYNKYKRIDVLVNNAGIWAEGTVETTSLETWERIFAVNVRGTFLVSRAVIPYMKAQKSGSIINISSNYGLVGGLNCAAYVASKGAIVLLTYSMALDFAPYGIRVNCICPGTIDTPIIQEPMKRMSKEEIERITASRIARHPLGRIGKPEEVAPGVVYLASNRESSFVTGAVLSIDGGYVAR